MPAVASRQFRNRRRSRPGTPSEGLTVVQHIYLDMTTNFKSIDFPENTLSPTKREETEDGWKLNWNYSSLLTSYAVAMHMPEKLQPGPLAGQISFFAPVSLFFFFFLIFIITTMRNIDLHPMKLLLSCGGVLRVSSPAGVPGGPFIDSPQLYHLFAGIDFSGHQLSPACREHAFRPSGSGRRTIRVPRPVFLRILFRGLYWSGSHHWRYRYSVCGDATHGQAEMGGKILRPAGECHVR